MLDKLRRVPTWFWALLFSLALCLPRLGGFGFWDPWELKVADQVRDIARSGHLFDPTVGSKYPANKPLTLGLAALGIKLFGLSELGARLFIALCAVGALMAVYWAGVGLFRRRAALLSTLVLGSMTLFVLEARQLTSDTPLIAGLALALGGLGRYAWPAAGRRRLGDLLVGVAGLVIGYLAGGALTGVVLPALSLSAALAVGAGLRPGDPPADDGTAELALPGVGLDIPAGRSFGQSTLRPGARGAVVFYLLTAAAVGLLIASMVGNVAGHYSALLGGVPRAGGPTHTFESLVRQLGFGLFPWSAVAVFALARPLIRLDAQGGAGEGVGDRTNPRLAFGEVYLFLFAGIGFALSTYKSFVLGEARYVALPAIALAVGAFLDEALEGKRSEPVAGLLMAVGTMIVARDFYLTPEELASVHLLEKVRWPPTISIGELVMVVGLIAAAGVYTGLATRSRYMGNVAGRDLSGAGKWRRLFERLVTVAGRWGLQVAVGCAVAFAFFVAQGLVPRLSTHLSFKPALESYSKFAKPGEKIAKYRVEGHGGGFYGSEDIVDVPSLDKLIVFLRDPNRVFALVSADELAPLDAAFKQAKQPYYVVDASSSRFLLLSNRLEGGQQDQNPLEKNVWMPPAGGDGKPPWQWRVPLAATFGDAIELVGADFPTSVRRPGKIPLDLYFHVKQRPPGGYKIFVHFDGPAAPRVIGDHDPVGKAFGTGYWLPGEYIRDHYETDVPLMTTPGGTYQVFVGFWPGGEGRRLKVTQGPSDGVDRVRLGTLEVK